MKNLSYMPFVRNRYYYGKLLTSEDFEQEQGYVNDKRRLINRWVIGAGVVAGLEIIKVDDYSISLEMGLALDETGREIVVDSPVIKKLSMLHGFEEATANTGEESLYLCIEYDEESVNPVQAITQSSRYTGNEPEYNQMRESYHLYVTDDLPTIAETIENCQTEDRYIFDRAEKLCRNKYQQGIYLAKINLVKAEAFYMIDSIEQQPFYQYAYSNLMMMGRILEAEKALEDLRSKWGQQGKKQEPKLEEGQQKEFPWQLEEGRVNMVLEKRKKVGDALLFPWIPHGLGLGDVQIFPRILWDDMIYCGAEGVFPEEEQKAVLAVRVRRNDGMFQIGARLLEDIEATSLTIHWTAIRNRTHNEIKEQEARIYIKPGMSRIKVRERVQFHAVCVNMKEQDICWLVPTLEGGTIGNDGLYHAPNRPGIYEIRAESISDKEVKSNVFAVVTAE